MQNLDKSISCARKANFLKEIPIFNYDTSYWGSWRGGLQQGLEKPIIGIGPSGTRHSCGLLEDHWLPGKNYCGNHPHNIYIQLFAEVGFLGLILGILTFFFITMKCFMSRDSIYKCPLNLTAFIIPLGIFFPLQHFGSFYGQWGNLFIWFAIGFALSNVNIYKTKKNNY